MPKIEALYARRAVFKYVFHEMMVAPRLVDIHSFGAETRMTCPGHKPVQWYVEAVLYPDHITSKL